MSLKRWKKVCGKGETIMGILKRCKVRFSFTCDTCGMETIWHKDKNVETLIEFAEKMYEGHAVKRIKEGTPRMYNDKVICKKCVLLHEGMELIQKNLK